MKLTVGILTYERPEYFREALSSIINNLTDKNRHELEIIIGDNEPGDTATKRIGLQYQKDFSGLIAYYQHERNIGPDANANFIFTKARGDYVWLLCDDDAFSPGAIDYMLHVIKEHSDAALIFTNYEECKADFELNIPRIRPEIFKDEISNSGEEFIEKSKFLFGLTSSLIIKTTLWRQNVQEWYIGSAWAHVLVALSILSKPIKAYIISKKLILFRLLEKERTWCQGAKQYFIPAAFHKIILEMNRLGYNKAVCNEMSKNHYSSLLQSLLCVARDNTSFYSRIEIAKDLVDKYSQKPSMWTLYLPIIFTPSFIMKVFYSGYKIFKRLKAKI